MHSFISKPIVGDNFKWSLGEIKPGILLKKHTHFWGGCYLGDKMKVYVSSFDISTIDYVDQKSMGHPCVTSRHSENIYTGLKHLPRGYWDGYLTEDQMKAVDVVCEFCEENSIEYEIVDIENLSSLSKMKLMLKGIKAPTVSFRGKKIEGVPSKEDLRTLNANR